MAHVKTLALLPPDVLIYTRGLTRREPSDEWTRTARTLVADYVTGRFEADGRFLLKQVDPTQAQEEFEEVRRLFARAAERPTDQTQDGVIQCLPGPFPKLGAVAEADAWLLVYALKHVKTTGRRAGEVAAALGLGLGLMILTGPFLGPTLGALHYDSGGENVLAICLVDAKTGETLWFGRQRFRHDLRDRESTRELVTDLYDEFRKVAPPVTPGTLSPPFGTGPAVAVAPTASRPAPLDPLADLVGEWRATGAGPATLLLMRVGETLEWVYKTASAGNLVPVGGTEALRGVGTGTASLDALTLTGRVVVSGASYTAHQALHFTLRREGDRLRGTAVGPRNSPVRVEFVRDPVPR